jgi:hypothetical protein
MATVILNGRWIAAAGLEIFDAERVDLVVDEGVIEASDGPDCERPSAASLNDVSRPLPSESDRRRGEPRSSSSVNSGR